MENILKVNTDVTTAYIEAEELKNMIGSTVYIRGVIYKLRIMSGFAFVILKSKGCLVQCVHSEEYADFPVSQLQDNMSVILKGDVVSDERSRTGYEIRVLSIKPLSQAVSETPVVINNKKVDASLETLLDYRPITLRNIKESAVFKIQEGICKGFRDFLYRNRFTEVHTPKIVFAGAEGGANVFKLDYFGRQAFLAQSPQFYKQTLVGVYERVFEISPVYRAEKHDTSRHINEYISVDLEMGFIDSFYEIMRTETKMIKEAFDFLKEYYAEQLMLLNVCVPEINEIPSLTFLEAKELVSNTYNREITDFEDFEPEEEKLICDIIKKKENNEFVFITHYKSSKRPFYAKDSKENPELTDSFDLLFRGMEVTTGGQRINDYNEQVKKMKARGMTVELFDSYLMAHKYGLPPHGGLGLGLERFTARLLNFPNVRYAAMFPRDINRLEP